jgi:hypothetical protein
MTPQVRNKMPINPRKYGHYSVCKMWQNLSKRGQAISVPAFFGTILGFKRT